MNTSIFTKAELREILAKEVERVCGVHIAEGVRQNTESLAFNSASLAAMAIIAARAYNKGLEDAARWHDEEKSGHLRSIRNGRFGNHETRARFHGASAAAIRALKWDTGE